jgi:signal transduction histidine kinase
MLLDIKNIILIVIFLANTFLAYFSYFKSRKTKTNVVWTFVVLAIISWTLSMIFYRSSDAGTSLLWCRLLYISAALIPLPLLYFVFLFPEGEWRISKLMRILLTIPPLVVIYLVSFSDLIFSAVKLIPGQEKEIIWGKGYIFYALYFSTYFTSVLLLFIIKYFKSSSIIKAQLKYIISGVGLSIIFGCVFNLVLPWVGDFRFNWLGQVSTIFMVLFISYVVARYRFIDIGFFAGKSFIYFSSFLVVISLDLVLFFINEKMEKLPEKVIAIISLIVGILIFQPVLNFFEKIAAKYFFHTFYSYQTVLTELGRKLTQILDLDQLTSLITETLMSTMKLDRVVVLLREKNGSYGIKKNIGFREENGISLVKDNFLTTWLEKTQKPLVYEEISLLMRDTILKDERTKLENLQTNMKKIEASLCIPLLSKDKIIGMIVLGSKISMEPYSEQDVNLLSTLANQSSIALQNAKLYSEIKTFNVNLEREVEKRTEELQKAYEELKKLDDAKSEFISIASHQLRTPLTAIKGYISMILENTYGKLIVKMRGPLENVYASNERLLKLVNDLLNVSRIESGKLEFKQEKTSIEKIISGVVGDLTLQAGNKNLYLKFEAPKVSLPEITIDGEKIRQALLNIVDNAIKYTQKGGVTIKVKTNNNKYCVQITDTGEGMTQDEISGLFESFSRGKAGNKLWTEGSGLGLYVAKKFIEMHKGKIWTESEGKGKGSTFFIELPIA